MSIDIGALRRFQATWGPVIAVIPDVINMAEQQADFERGLAAKRLELDKAGKEIVDAYAEADKRLSALNEEMVAANAQKTAVLSDIEIARQAAAEAAKAADASAKAKLAAVEAKVAERSAVLTTVDTKIMDATAAAQATHAKAVADMAAEIADLEKRKAAAEKALDALRAKLG